MRLMEEEGWVTLGSFPSISRSQNLHILRLFLVLKGIALKSRLLSISDPQTGDGLLPGSQSGPKQFERLHRRRFDYFLLRHFTDR